MAWPLAERDWRNASGTDDLLLLPSRVVVLDVAVQITRSAEYLVAVRDLAGVLAWSIVLLHVFDQLDRAQEGARAVGVRTTDQW